MAETSTLPIMMTRQQAREFLQVSGKSLDRMLADGTVPSCKLGTGRSAPIRIPRDKLLESLGLTSRTDDHRRRRAADAERHIALAAVGGGE